MKTIVLVAHDSRKKELVEWVKYNKETLLGYSLVGTGTTASMIREVGLEVKGLNSGPLGGDQEIGAMIAHGEVDVLIFFCDNLQTQGHQNDVSALTRLASLYNIAFATNRTTADMILTSPLILDEAYKPILPGAIETYKNRFKHDKESTKSDTEE